MPPVSTTTRTTSLRKRRPHGKPPSAGTTSTQSSGSPKFERCEQRQRIERPHLTPALSLLSGARARPQLHRRRSQDSMPIAAFTPSGSLGRGNPPRKHGGKNNLVDELERIAKLREAGAISKGEFERA